MGAAASISDKEDPQKYTTEIDKLLKNNKNLSDAELYKLLRISLNKSDILKKTEHSSNRNSGPPHTKNRAEDDIEPSSVRQHMLNRNIDGSNVKTLAIMQLSQNIQSHRQMDRSGLNSMEDMNTDMPREREGGGPILSKKVTSFRADSSSSAMASPRVVSSPRGVNMPKIFSVARDNSFILPDTTTRENSPRADSSKGRSEKISASNSSDSLKLSATSSPKPSAPALQTSDPKVKRRKPNLSVTVDSDDGGQDAQVEGGRPKSPGVEAIFSPSGTVHIGNWDIREDGLVSAQDDTHLFLSCGRTDFVEVGSLGTGASGSVMEAVHIPTLTLVALKMLTVSQVDKIQNIARELNVLYQNLAALTLTDDSLDKDNYASEGVDFFDLNGVSGRQIIQTPTACPQVLSLYDAFTNPKSGMVNLVVEYMDGGSLQDVVNHGGCNDEEVLADAAHQMLLGMSYLHANNQIHRDIKPGNILLNCHGLVKLADFGVSKDLVGSLANAFVGTMCYMAPERISGERYGFPSDVWSFGLTLLTVARGEFPLKTNTGAYWGLLKLICDEEPPVAGAAFSASFNDFINICLKKNPAERATLSQLMNHSFLHNTIDRVYTDRNSIGTSKSFERSPMDRSPAISRDREDAGHYLMRVNRDIGASMDVLDRLNQDMDSLPNSPRAKCKTPNTVSPPPSMISNSLSTESTLGKIASGCRSATNRATTPNGQSNLSDFLTEEARISEILYNLKIQHAELILNKIQAKYEHAETAIVMHELQGGTEDSLRLEPMYTSEPIRDAYRFIKMKIPNYNNAGVEQTKWEHLASQLLLPLDSLLPLAREILNNKYLSDADQ